MRSATLSSNDGNKKFVIEFNAPVDYAHDPGFEASIHIQGESWDGDHTFPFSTSIAGLWLRAEDLTEFQEHISRWLRRPLAELTPEKLNADFQLTRLPGQRLDLKFGSRANVISDQKPVLTITFSSGALRGEFYLVTDQSCLALFVQDLSSGIVSAEQ